MAVKPPRCVSKGAESGGLLGCQELLRGWEDRSPTPKCSVGFFTDWSITGGRGGYALSHLGHKQSDRDSWGSLPPTGRPSAENNASIFFSEYQRQLKSATNDLPCHVLFLLQSLKMISSKISPYAIICLVSKSVLDFRLCFTALCIL